MPIRGSELDIFDTLQVLAAYGYDQAGDTIAECVRVVCQDREKSSELLAKSVSVITAKTCLFPMTCPCDDDKPNPCPKCGACVRMTNTDTIPDVSSSEEWDRLSPQRKDALLDQLEGDIRRAAAAKLPLGTSILDDVSASKHVDCDCMDCRPWTS